MSEDLRIEFDHVHTPSGLIEFPEALGITVATLAEISQELEHSGCPTEEFELHLRIVTTRLFRAYKKGLPEWHKPRDSSTSCRDAPNPR